MIIIKCKRYVFKTDDAACSVTLASIDTTLREWVQELI